MRRARTAPVMACLLAVGLTACKTGNDIEPLSSAPPSLRVAETTLNSGAAQVALAMLNGIVAREPRNAIALARQGDAFTALGRDEAAADSYRRALAVDPRLLDAQLGLGRLALASDPAAAETLFAAVVAARPQWAVALNDLGIAQDELGHHAEAQAKYRAAIAAAPGMTAAMANLGLSLALSGQAEEAVAMLQPLAADPASTPRVRHDYAAALVLSGHRAEAERVLRRDLREREAKDALDAFSALAPDTPAAQHDVN